MGAASTSSDPVPDAPDEPTQEDAELVLSPGKVVRLGAMVDAIVDELHDRPVDSASRDRVRDLYRTALIEVGSTLSDPLLDELAHLQPADRVESDDDLRIVVAQLAGWIHGLRDGMASGAVPFMLPGTDLPDAPPAA